MFRSLFHRASLPRLGWGLFLVLLLAVCAEHVGKYRHSTDTNIATNWKTHLTATEVEQRSLKLCLGFSDTARMVSKPEFWVQEYTFSPTGKGHRPVWRAYCEADGRGYILDFNDMTGNLMGLRAQYLDNEAAIPTVKTPEAATHIALMYLHQLDPIPAGTHWKLKGVPEHQNNHTWHLRWSLSDPASEAPNQLLIILSDVDGKLMKVVNDRELKIYDTHAMYNSITPQPSPNF